MQMKQPQQRRQMEVVNHYSVATVALPPFKAPSFGLILRCRSEWVKGVGRSSSLRPAKKRVAHYLSRVFWHRIATASAKKGRVAAARVSRPLSVDTGLNEYSTGTWKGSRWSVYDYDMHLTKNGAGQRRYSALCRGRISHQNPSRDGIGNCRETTSRFQLRSITARVLSGLLILQLVGLVEICIFKLAVLALDTVEQSAIVAIAKTAE